MDLLVIGEGNWYSIVYVGHIHVMMESALYTTMTGAVGPGVWERKSLDVKGGKLVHIAEFDD